jgi:cysteine synthase A
MQGWSPDFISGLTEEARSAGLIDKVVAVPGAEALELSRRLAREEGIFAGISAGATLAGALQVAGEAAPGSNIVCMLPDTGERYQSTVLFEDIAEDMNQAEIELSRSTPSCRFEPPVPTVAASTDGAIEPDFAASRFVSEQVDSQPVLMFALEWCEFCWSVRKLFTAMDLPYESIDLDAVSYQQDDRGGRIRKVLQQRLGVPTIPQIFVGGEHIGGCSELFDAYRDGSLQRRLCRLGVPFDDTSAIDADGLLPQWLHPRKSA